MMGVVMNDIPKGYKQTDVGLIPEDWGVLPLGRLIHSVEYGSAAKSSATGRVPVLRMGNLQGGKIDWNDLVYTDNEIEIRKYSLVLGDVLFNRTNTIDLVGKTAIYKGERAAVFAGYLIRINSDKALLDSAYLNYILNAEFSRKHSAKILSIAVGQANINGQKLKSYPVPLPPTKAEQEAIAEALSDADALIESLEQLLAKKRQIKQGAMQELLTGKKRLPGFSGEWEVKRFGEIAQPRKERIDPRRAGPKTFCIELEHIEQGTGCLVGCSATSEGSSLKSVFQVGDVLFGKLRAYLRKYWLADREGVCSTEIWVLVANRPLIIPDFLFQVVKVDRFVEAASSAYGTHMPRSDWSVVRNFEVHLPPAAEQTAIAAILSDMDAEIAALATKLAKARRVKQGMMQELLTGRIRLRAEARP
jgi:type I restriction enzyme S subunit